MTKRSKKASEHTEDCNPPLTSKQLTDLYYPKGNTGLDEEFFYSLVQELAEGHGDTVTRFTARGQRLFDEQLVEMGMDFTKVLLARGLLLIMNKTEDEPDDVGLLPDTDGRTYLCVLTSVPEDKTS